LRASGFFFSPLFQHIKIQQYFCVVKFSFNLIHVFFSRLFFSTSKFSSISVLSTIPNTIVVFQAHYNRSREHPDYIPFNAYSPSGLVRVSITSCNMCTFFPFDLFYNYLCNQCISPLLTKVVSLNPVHGKVNSMQHYIKFVSDLRQVGSLLQVLRFPPPIKLTSMI
jgi:hypothetical protein